MDRMQTRTDSIAPALNWLDPFGSWEAAARWNAIASDWMTTGWKQWLELVTVWPALEPATGDASANASAVTAAGASAAPASEARASAVIPAKAGTQEARDARALQAQERAHAVDSRLRGKGGSSRNDGSRRSGGTSRSTSSSARPSSAKRTEHAAAKTASKRPAAKRPARPQAAARSTRTRG